MGLYATDCFSPRNGEIILKAGDLTKVGTVALFQSPQWGDNSKGCSSALSMALNWFQSPQWGDNSKVGGMDFDIDEVAFQSPQWGDNSKD